MTDPEPSTETPPATTQAEHMLAPLVRSMPVAYVIFAFLILGLALSTLLFLVQFRAEVEPGIRLIDSRSGRLAVLAHLARACACLLLALSLHKYIASLRRIRDNAADATDRFFKASRFLWNTFCICALLVVGFGVWAIDVSLDPAADFPSGVEMYAATPQADARVEFYLAEIDPGEGLQERKLKSPGRSVWLPAKPIITNENFLEARVEQIPNQVPNIMLKLNEEGAAILRKASREHVGRPLAVVVDGEVIMAPTIHTPMGAEVMISGGITVDEAKRIARSLSGSK